jgi:hypothetical protein
VFCFAPCVGAIASVVAKETFKDVGVIVAELLCDDAHLQVRICGKKILSKPKPRLDLISLHACAEGLAKGSLKGPHRGAELGRDPRHPELSMAVVDGDQVMRKHWGLLEFLGDFAFQYLDAYVTDQCEGLVFHTRQGGVLTRSQESTACPAGESAGEEEVGRNQRADPSESMRSPPSLGRGGPSCL